MNFFNLNAEFARNLSDGAVVASVIAFLVVLKFASSLVTKLLLLAVCGLVGYIGFTQRDSLNACIEVVTAQASTGSPIKAECTLLGQKVSVNLPSLPSEG